MPYRGKDGGHAMPLTEFVDTFEDLVPLAAKAIVDDATDYQLRIVKENTPVSSPIEVEGYEPRPPGGDGIHMREEIHRTETIERGDVFSANVETDKDYATFVEEGTGLYGPSHAKYLIVPHDPAGSLAWPGADGKMHFASHVWHPGSPGQHMFAIGHTVTEASSREWRQRGDRILVEGMK